MLLIDKLCYQSNLRYVNAGEKFIYAILTLCMCVVSRSIPLAVLVLAVNSYLIVGRGGIAFFRYRNLMLIPLVFLLLSTLAIIVNISGTPLDAFALPLGNLYIYRKLPVSAPGTPADPHRHGQCLLPLFSGSQHTHDGYPQRTAEASDPRSAAGTDDAHLPLHLCAAGDRLQHPYLPEIQAGTGISKHP